MLLGPDEEVREFSKEVKRFNRFLDKMLYKERLLSPFSVYSLHMSQVRAIRGATQLEANTASAMESATKELLLEILAANELTPEDLISVFLTVTPDLNAAFPAAFAREVGFQAVPLLCAVEIDVPGALARVLRVMIHCNTTRNSDQISHIYLHGAKALRRDIAQ
jgi:chorismate mutase